MVRKKAIGKHLINNHEFQSAGFFHRNDLYSRPSDDGSKITATVYRTTLFMTHIHIFHKDENNKILGSVFMNVKSMSDLQTLDSRLVERMSF